MSTSPPLAQERGGAAVTPPPRVPRRAQAIIALLGVVALTLAAMVLGDSRAPEAAAEAAAVDPTGHTAEVTVRVDGMSFVPSTIEVAAGDALVIRFENTGDQRHDLVVASGATTGTVPPGGSATLDAGIVAQTTTGWCSLAGHRAMGMELDIIAVGGASQASGGDDAVHDVEAPSMAALETAAQASPAVPAKLPPLAAVTRHEYTFTVTESTEQVAEGVTRTVWSYNGGSPGPTLHGRVGDTFVITLVNAGSMGHSIDFHAGELAPDGPMRTIEPGETLVYEFTAGRSGVWMYHCSTMPMSQHIANGMFGAVVIEPPGLEAVDRSYVLLQSEMYLGENGGAASASKASAGIPDVVAFNGRAFQYVAHPLEATVGERVRLWVLDAGPGSPLAFHVVGAQFDTVWSEGAYSVYRGASTDGLTAGTTGAQVLPLSAAQGGFVEMVASEAGDYPFVNHQMALAEKGAKGILRVTDTRE